MLVNLLREVVVFWAEVKVSFRLGDLFLGDQYFCRGERYSQVVFHYPHLDIIIKLFASDLYNVLHCISVSYDVTSYHSKGMGVLKIWVGFVTYLYIPFGQSKYRTNLVMVAAMLTPWSLFLAAIHACNDCCDTDGMGVSEEHQAGQDFLSECISHSLHKVVPVARRVYQGTVSADE